MRTEYVLVPRNNIAMLNPITAESLVRDRQRELLAAAAQRRLVGHRLDSRSLRVRTGWLLVRAGSRLARPGPADHRPLLDQSESRGRDRGLHGGEVDDELGAMRRKDVLRHEDRPTRSVGGDALAPEHGRAGRNLQQGRVG